MASETRVDLVDCGGGNLGSVSRCLHRLGIDFRMVSPDAPPDGRAPLILPGVGAFGTFMAGLRREEFDRKLIGLVRDGTPYLGICVGMQVLFDRSEEAPGVAGLGLIAGDVVRYVGGKVPQIGWNHIESPPGLPVFSQAWPSGYVYFVNSYYPAPIDRAAVLYTADYYGLFCAAVRSSNITAFQFHPEKSGDFGHALIRRWYDEL